MYGKKIMAAFLALIIVFFCFSPIGRANDIDDLKGQLDSSQDKIDSMKEQKKDLQEQIKDDQAQIENLQTNINTVNNNIEDMKQKIASVQLKIITTTRELNAAIGDYNSKDQLMKNRINALYKNGTTVGYLEVVLESQSFADFISRADIMKKVMDYDLKMLKEMKQKREEIDAKKNDLDKDQNNLVSYKQDLDNQKNSLVGQKKNLGVMVASRNAKVQSLNSAIADEEKAASDILKKIKAMQSKGNYDGSKYAILHKSDFPSGAPRITSGFGSRVDPITGVKSAFHSGIDIGTALHTNIPVYSMAPGRVILAQWYGGYGNAVIIDHGSGLSTLYGHNNKLLVKVGDVVAGGQQIALSGSTGRSTGPHVHFGAIKNGEYIDPTPYLYISD